jgi:hypothetical protein
MKTLTATLLAFTFATGCAHTGAAELAVTEVAVAGEVVEADACGEASMQTHFFHGRQGVQKRVIDRERCGVVELRVVDVLDAQSDTRVREILRDLDHDGEFERRAVETEKLEGSFAVLARNGVAAN